MLGPKPRENLELTELRDIENRGYYSKEDMDDYINSINFPIERNIIIDNTATNIHEMQQENGIDPDTNFFMAIVERKFNKYWMEFKDFRSISAAICTSILIIVLIGYIINVIINALQLRKIIGCSFGLGAALLSSATNIIIRKADKSHMTESETPHEEIELAAIEIPNPSTSTTNSEITIPKTRRTLVRYLSPHLVSRKIQTSFRKITKKSTETQAHSSGEND